MFAPVIRGGHTGLVRPASRRRSGTGRRVRGLTLVELLVALAATALLATLAYPSYRSYILRNQVTQAITDITHIELALERYQTVYGNLPASLAEAGITAIDPWGNPYQFLRMSDAKVGQVRKDHSLHPLNTDYDLYSMGADGKSASPLTAKASRDDIIRARNGGFVDLASKY